MNSTGRRGNQPRTALSSFSCSNPVTIVSSRMPTRTRLRIDRFSIGTPSTGSRPLGVKSVNGRRRVELPAARMTALMERPSSSNRRATQRRLEAPGSARKRPKAPSPRAGAPVNRRWKADSLARARRTRPGSGGSARGDREMQRGQDEVAKPDRIGVGRRRDRQTRDTEERPQEEIDVSPGERAQPCPGRARVVELVHRADPGLEPPAELIELPAQPTYLQVERDLGEEARRRGREAEPAPRAAGGEAEAQREHRVDQVIGDVVEPLAERG